MNQHEWMEISFRHGGLRHTYVLHAPGGIAQTSWAQGLQDVSREQTKAVGLEDWEVLPLAADAQGRYLENEEDGASSAIHLVETAWSGLSNPLAALDTAQPVSAWDHACDPEELAVWRRWHALSEKLDALPQPKQTYRIEWTWDNGGDDDNLFAQCVQVSATPAAKKIWRQWQEVFEEIAESFGPFYDPLVIEETHGLVFEGRSREADLARFLEGLGQWQDHEALRALFKGWSDYRQSQLDAQMLEHRLPKAGPGPRSRL